MATPEQIEKFKRENWPHALAVAQQTGVDPRIVMAQAAVESDWGNAAPNNNVFGIKDFSGKGSSQPTTEVIDGKTVKVDQPFAKYDSPEGSFGGYAKLIGSNERYRPFRTAPGYGAQIAELGKSGYATDPNYASVVDQTARNLDVPGDVKPSVLAMNVSGAGAGGAGVVAPTPTPAPTLTAGLPPSAAASLGILAANSQRQQYASTMGQAQALMAAGAPTQVAPQRAIPMLQANRPRAQLNAAPIIPGLRGLLG
jgi:hypothetical protein